VSSIDLPFAASTASPPPPAPRPVPPGVVPWNARFLILFGAIWGGVGVLLFVVFTAVGGPFWSDILLDQRGVRVDAQPVSVDPTNTRVNRRPVYAIQVRFRDRGGQEQSASVHTTDGTALAAARKKSPIAIEYDPESPTRTRLVGGSASTFGLLVLLPLAFAVIGAVLFFRGLSSRRRAQALYRDGEAAEAVVVAVEATASTQNMMRVMRMDYEAQGPGPRVRGSWKTLTPAPVGAKIWILYDRADPERSVPARG
jgi:hypothetical protein